MTPLFLPLAGPALALLTSSLAGGIVTVALPVLERAFDAPFGRVQAVLVAYLASITLLVAVAGTLADRLGRRRLMLAGLAVFSMASALCALAPTLPLLIAARALQGLGAALMMALATALVADTVPAERRGHAMGWLGSASAVGTALGPALGGALTGAFGWRSIFAVLVPFGLAAAWLVTWQLPADRPRPTGASQPSGAWHRTVVPLWRSLATNLLVSMTMMGTLLVGPFYLGGALGLSAAEVGLAMSAGPVSSALGGLPAGRLVDRIGPHRAVLIGVLSLACGALGLAVQPGVAGYLVALVAMTQGYALFQAANNTAVMAAAGAAHRGTAAGWLGLSRQAGLLVGAGALGAVFAWGGGSAAPAAGLRATFTVAAGAMVLALGLSIGRSRRPAT
jgi:MFS family permease